MRERTMVADRKGFLVGRDDEGNSYYVRVRLEREHKRDSYQTADQGEISEYLSLSLTYDEYDRQGFDIGGGAGVPDLPDRVTRPKDAAQLARFAELAREWHLNGMSAGCSHQNAEGWAERPIDPSKPTNTYGRHFSEQSQDTWNMLAWIRPDEHPDGLLTKPCSECGYKYGTAWLVRPLPEEIIEEVKGWGIEVTEGLN